MVYFDHLEGSKLVDGSSKVYIKVARDEVDTVRIPLYTTYGIWPSAELMPRIKMNLVKSQ